MAQIIPFQRRNYRRANTNRPFVLLVACLMAITFGAGLLLFPGAAAPDSAPMALVAPQIRAFEPPQDVSPVNLLESSATVANNGSGDSLSASFSRCSGAIRMNCVVDGDTFWFEGAKIRIVDIDTPEVSSPKCAWEAQQGARATRRLQTLLNQGAFSLSSIDRDSDRYGRKLRIVTRGGESLGGILVGEGLARYYNGGRQPWC